MVNHCPTRVRDKIQTNQGVISHLRWEPQSLIELQPNNIQMKFDVRKQTDYELPYSYITFLLATVLC